MNYRDHKQRFLVRCISNKVIEYHLKSNWLRREIRPRPALMWKTHKLTDRIQDGIAKASCRGRIFLRDELPDVGDVLRSARVQLKTLVIFHLGGRFLKSSCSRWRRFSKNPSPSMAS